jgi:type I restriction enzyme S subunit
MAVKPGYKQTEVGVIPEAWEVKTIGQMFRLVNGCAFKPDDWKQSGTPIIRIQNLNDPDAEFNYSQAPVPERNRIEAGDLLFAWSGTLGSSFGPRVWNGPSGVLNQHIFKVLMDEEQITLPFSLLVFARVEEDIAKQAHGFKASFVHVKKSDLVKVDLPLPPLPEQRAIATALSDVDGLLGGLDRLIAKKRDLKQAAMQQLLTGQTRLPGFHGDWEVKRLGDVGKCLRGVSYKGDSDLSTHDTIHTKRLLRSNNVQNAIVVTDDVQFVNAARVAAHQMLKKDDILICMANGSKALVGKAGIFMVSDGHGYTFGAFMGCFRTNSADANPAFVFYFFLTGRYRDYINNLLAGSSINNLRPSSIESLEFPMPPIPEQTAIASVLTEMDGELAGLEQRREKTRALKQAMMQELLTGRTRLV